MNENKTSDLERWVRAHAPSPPAPPENHEEKMLLLIETEKKKRWPHGPTISVMVLAAAAAATLSLWIYSQRIVRSSDPELQEAAVSQEAIVGEIVISVIEDYDRENTPEDLYEDWQALAQVISQK